jgi:hypothetical protein
MEIVDGTSSGANVAIRPPPAGDQTHLIVGIAVLATALKLFIAFSTLGTNDVAAFYQFEKSIGAHGLTWTYEHSVLFNHPPLVGYFLLGLARLDQHQTVQQMGLTFPFLLRIPGIVADFCVVLALLWTGRLYPELRPPTWAMLLFAASPVSVMVTGFHGNTDAVMVLFLVLSTLAAARKQPVLAGVLLALSCQIKIIPILLVPIFVFYWVQHRQTLRYLVALSAIWILLSIEPLLRSPVAFIQHVVGYGGFWGIWGFTYLLRIIGLPQFSRVSFFGLTPAQQIIMSALKAAVIALVVLLAWRRRKLDGVGLFHSIAYAWMIFFVFAPGVAAQYLIWLAPFILLLAPSFYGILVATSAIFLFILYTVSSGGFPWYFAHVSSKHNLLFGHCALLPWLTLVAGLAVMVRKARQRNPNLKLFSLTPVEPLTTVE